MRATCTPKGCGSRRSSSGTAACGDDVINLLLCNMRARRQEGDLNAQYGACRVGERHLRALLAKYGLATVQAAIAELKDMADRHMRSLIASIPDGTYHGRARLEDAGHGHGDMTISAAVTVNGDSVHPHRQRPRRRCRTSSIPTRAIRCRASTWG